MEMDGLSGVLRLDDTDWQRGLRSAEQSLSRFAAAATNSFGRVQQSAQKIDVERLSRAGNSLTLKLTAPLLGVGAAAVRAGSDLEETLNKTQVLFGQNAQAVQRWAATSAAGFGQTQQQALAAAGSFAAILQSAGATESQVASMSTALTRLGGDLASFHNIATGDALEKLRSGIVGEREPLQTLGILLSEDAVKAEAARVGIAALGAELTEGQKVQARYSFILRQSQSAHGDFARTSDSLANTMRSLQQELGDAAAKLGKELIPAAKQGLAVAREMLHGWNALGEGAQKTILTLVGMVGIGAAVGPLVRLTAVVLQAAAAWRTLAAAQALAGVAAAGSGAAATIGAAVATGTATALGGAWPPKAPLPPWAGNLVPTALRGAAAGAVGTGAGAAVGAAGAAVGAGALGVGAAGGLGAAALIGGWGYLGYTIGNEFWGNARLDRAEASLARQAAGRDAFNEKRRAEGRAYFDSQGRLQQPRAGGALGGYDVPLGGGAGAMETPAALEKRRREARDLEAARSSTLLDTGLTRAGIAGSRAPDGSRAQVEAAGALPVLRAEQQRLAAQLRTQRRDSEAYWNTVRQVWRLEEQANSLAMAATRERSEAQERARTQAQALYQTRTQALLDIQMQRAGAAVAGAPDAEKAGAEARAVVPVLRAEQQRLLATMRSLGPQSQEYWTSAREVWRLESQAAKLGADAARERQDAMQDALREQQRALDGVRQAAQKDRSLAEQRLGLSEARTGSNPFLNPMQRYRAGQEALLTRFRMAVTPTLGETEEQRIERQLEAEKLRMQAYQSIGAGRYQQTRGGFVPAFDVRRARRLEGLLGGIERDAMQRGPASGEQAARALQDAAAAGGNRPVVNVNVNQSGNIFTDPAARARLFQEIWAALDAASRQTNPGMTGY